MYVYIYIYIPVHLGPPNICYICTHRLENVSLDYKYRARAHIHNPYHSPRVINLDWSKTKQNPILATSILATMSSFNIVFSTLLTLVKQDVFELIAPVFFLLVYIRK